MWYIRIEALVRHLGGFLNKTLEEIRHSLWDLRNATAAAMRVMARNKLVDEFEKELLAAGVREGFGTRGQDAIVEVLKLAERGSDIDGGAGERR